MERSDNVASPSPRFRLRLKRGDWWVYARSWDPWDPNGEWYWNVPLRGGANPRIVAVGETGLDYYRLNGRSVADMAWQRVRFRTLGCYPLSGAIESNADTLPAIIQEMLLARTSERQGRLIDHGQHVVVGFYREMKALLRQTPDTVS